MNARGFSRGYVAEICGMIGTGETMGLKDIAGG